MSVRVRRWDTGMEAEIPEGSLRWGPNTKQGTCRAALLRRPGLRADVALIGDVPYLLPFSGAKWAVRVDFIERPDALPGDVFLHLPPRRGWVPSFERGGFRSVDIRGCPVVVEEPTTPRRSSFTDPGARQRLRSLIDAAEEALKTEHESAAEQQRDLGRCSTCWAPIRAYSGVLVVGDGLCASCRSERARPDAGPLLARVLDEASLPRALAAEIRAFLERETSADIRRAWEG